MDFPCQRLAAHYRRDCFLFQTRIGRTETELSRVAGTQERPARLTIMPAQAFFVKRLHLTRERGHAFVKISCRVFLLIGLLAPEIIRAQSPGQSSAALVQFLHAGDRSFVRFDNYGALEAYGKAVALDSSNYEGLWKLARAYVDVGYGAKGEEQERRYSAALRLARRCAALYPDSVESHFFLAVALGRMALKVGGKRKIALSKEIKAEAERTLALDPRHDGAMHVLGRWYYELGNLNWALRAFAKVLYGGVPPGGNDEAKTWFEKALAVAPNSPAHHLRLGETLIKLEQYETAREHLQACIALPDLLWDDDLNKQRAQRLLKEIAGKK